MKILILGAKGNLGRQLAKIFQKDYEVIGWDREEIDIADKELISKKIKDVKPEIIINAAAYNAVDKCESDDSEFALAKKINGQAVGYLADAALAIGALLAHYSTDYIFSGENKDGYREDDEPRPISKYGESKLMGEKEIIKRSGRGLKWYLIRTSKLFGPYGENSGVKDSFFDKILKLSERKKEFNFVDGEEISCFTYTPDLALATKRLIESEKGYGIYHITNYGAASWYEAAKELFKLAGRNDIKLNPIASKDYPRPAKRPAFSVLSDTKHNRSLRAWQEALREYLQTKKIYV